MGAKGDGGVAGVDGIAAADDEKFAAVARAIVGEAPLLTLLLLPFAQLVAPRDAREEKAASVRLSAARAATRRGEIMVAAFSLSLFLFFFSVELVFSSFVFLIYKKK